MNNHESSAQLAWRNQLALLLSEPVMALPCGVPSARSPLVLWDDYLKCAGYRFVIEYKVRSDAASVTAALEQVRALRAPLPKGVTPLLVVDWMGERGRALCEAAGVDWIDLAGNASITHVPRLRIVVEGKQPLRRTRGRPRNVFATKSSRVAHWLLLHQNRTATQQEIAEETGVDKGQLSRILSSLEGLQLVRRSTKGVTLLKPQVLLDSWREAYSPATKNVLRGIIPSRSGEETIRKVSELMKASGSRHVFGGLSAAWLLDGFADFRITTCHVAGALNPDALKEVGFIEAERGANLWLPMDADEVAFMGMKEVGGVLVTSPFFTYVDLASHPERSQEASRHLLEHVLRWETPLGS